MTERKCRSNSPSIFSFFVLLVMLMGTWSGAASAGGNPALGQLGGPALGLLNWFEDALSAIIPEREGQEMERRPGTRAGALSSRVNLFNSTPYAESGFRRPLFDDPSVRGGGIGFAAVGGPVQEFPITPSITVSAFSKLPLFEDSESNGATLMSVTGRFNGWDSASSGIHLKASWQSGMESGMMGAKGYSFAAGYDQNIGPDTLLSVDFVQEHQMNDHMGDDEMFETELNWQVAPGTTMGLTMGAGILADDSMGFKTGFGFHYSF